MKRSLILLLLPCLFGFSLFAQTSPNTYFVQFKNKVNSPHSLQNPSTYLSQKAIERRLNQGLGFDSLDIPVNQNYIQQVLDLGNAQLLLRSKWFNSITVQLNDTSLADEWKASVLGLACVLQVKSLPEIPWVNIRSGKQGEEMVDGINYGESLRQVSQLNGQFLHEMGFQGEGMDIAVFDAGYIRANQLPAMQKMFQEGRLIETHDFLRFNNPNVFIDATHGTFVLSHMAGIIPDSLYGTAVNANYYLFKTEDASQEVRLEEDTWIQAAEWADSIGIDVINSSLGYSVFDYESMSYQPADMNGVTTRISQAAEICVQKGTLVVNSAGNNGDDPFWGVITAPSDAKGVLCVGAVDADGVHASFSGYRPPGIDYVKPNIVAMGKQTVFAALDSTISRGNGTSFSSPIIAGLSACLWQAFPTATNNEIKDAIERSASCYGNPNDSMGYGIPDFWKAFLILSEEKYGQPSDHSVLVFPQPSADSFQVRISDYPPSGSNYFWLYNAAGQQLWDYEWAYSAEGSWGVFNLNLGKLPNGRYYFVAENKNGKKAIPLQKK